MVIGVLEGREGRLFKMRVSRVLAFSLEDPDQRAVKILPPDTAIVTFHNTLAQIHNKFCPMTMKKATLLYFLFH